MKCPFCGKSDTRVIDTRLSEEMLSIKRRRECIACTRRFITFETIEKTPIFVVKKSGGIEEFNPNKLKEGILKACHKRPISIEDVDKLVEGVYKSISSKTNQEVSTTIIGDLVMDGLKEIDDVAYVRFAAVHRQFKDISTWLQEIESVLKNKPIK